MSNPPLKFTVEERVKFVKCLGVLYQLEPALILAFFDKETGGEPWCEENEGRMKLGFEQGPFNREKKWHQIFIKRYGRFPKVQGCEGVFWRCKDQHREYEHLAKASALHKEHAHNATGMGVASTQGWEAFRMGYGDSVTMFERYSASEAEQVLGFLLFLQFSTTGHPMFGPQKASGSAVGRHLRAARRGQATGDLMEVARLYRGSEEKARYYGQRLTEFFVKWKKELAEDFEHGDDGLVGYGWSVDEATAPLADLRGVDATNLWELCRESRTSVEGATRCLEWLL